MCHRIKSFIENARLGKVFENIFSLYTLQFFTYVFPLITTPYIAKTIGLEKYGEIAFAASICLYFSVVVDYGFNYTATRDVAKSKANLDHLRLVCTRIFFSKLVLLCISALLYSLILILTSSFQSNINLYLFSFLMVINNLIYPKWFFQGIEKMKYITIFNVIVQILYVISIFTLIKNQSDFIYLPLFVGLFTSLVGMISMYVMYKYYKIRIVNISIRDVLDELDKGKFIFINQLLPNLYNNSSVLILGMFAPASSVGLYSAARKIVYIGIRLLKVITLAFFPHLSNSRNNFKLYVKVVLYFSLILATGFSLFAGLIFRVLYTPEFYDGVNLVYIMSAGFIFLGLYDCFGTNGLIHIGKERLLMKNTVFSSVFGFLLGVLLISQFFEHGAAISLTVTRGMMGIGVLYIYKTKLSYNYHSI